MSKMAKKPEYGLLIDYEYCTGCYACRLACCQEYGHAAGMSGMEVIEKVQPLPQDKAYLTYLPFPTELCVLCKPRTNKGLEPSCVKHCMADVIQFGRLEDLAQKLGQKARMVLWSPK
jgi:Fe-S-cluster-containing dehydrogenase component